jgi:hypothetical protein
VLEIPFSATDDEIYFEKRKRTVVYYYQYLNLMTKIESVTQYKLGKLKGIDDVMIRK